MLHDIGRRVKGRWAVSRVALQMMLDDDWDALKLYLLGDRISLAVVDYFTRLGVPIPRKDFRGGTLLSEPNSAQESL